MFDPISAIAIGAGSLLGGLFGSAGASQEAAAARQAAQLQREAAAEATQLQREQMGQDWKMYQQQRMDMSPFLKAGQQAIGDLSGMVRGGQLTDSQLPSAGMVYDQATGGYRFQPQEQFGFSTPAEFDFESDPGYQHRLQQGIEAIEGSAAARGGLFSGETGKELARFGQGLAAQEYGDAFQRHLGQKNLETMRDISGFEKNLGLAGYEASRSQQDINKYLGMQGAEQAQQQQMYNMYSGLAGAGQGAMGQLGSLQSGLMNRQAAGTQAMGNLAQQSAAAQGAGMMGGAQAYSGALQNWGNQLQSGLGLLGQYGMMRNMQQRPVLGPGY